MKNNTIIRTITERGQITLPAAWRKKTKIHQIALTTKGDTIEVTPLYSSAISPTAEYTVFDAIRDNKGKGLKAIDLERILKKIC